VLPRGGVGRCGEGTGFCAWPVMFDSTPCWVQWAAATRGSQKFMTRCDAQPQAGLAALPAQGCAISIDSILPVVAHPTPQQTLHSSHSPACYIGPLAGHGLGPVEARLRIRITATLTSSRTHGLSYFCPCRFPPRLATVNNYRQHRRPPKQPRHWHSAGP
jgi:hypothetical protein